MPTKGESEKAAVIKRHLQEAYGVLPEYLWAKYPNFAVFRRYDNAKWFSVLMRSMPKNKLGLDDKSHADLLNVKCDPFFKASLLDGKHYFPAYHMNKEHWLTILLDDEADMPQLFDLIALSYHLTGRKK